jgi:ribosomal protein L37AE/L43A
MKNLKKCPACSNLMYISDDEKMWMCSSKDCKFSTMIGDCCPVCKTDYNVLILGDILACSECGTLYIPKRLIAKYERKDE